jgi:hypothetical protein
VKRIAVGKMPKRLIAVELP